MSKEQLEFYLCIHFTVPQIVSMLKVSESTVKRRLKRFDLLISSTYTVISDIDLDNKILNKHCGTASKYGI